MTYHLLGYGNKSSHSGEGKSGDSTMGKLMEKAGGMFHNPKMAEKGAEKREAAGADVTDTYGSGTTGSRSDNY